MAEIRSVGARILAAQTSLCNQLAAELAAAGTAGASPEAIAELEARELAARRRYQELAVDMPTGTSAKGTPAGAQWRRPWWRFW